MKLLIIAAQNSFKKNHCNIYKKMNNYYFLMNDDLFLLNDITSMKGVY